MKTLRRAVVFALGALALLLPFAPSASATSAGAVVFVGTATTPPLGYPGISAPNSGTVTVTSTVCVGAAVNVGKPKPPAQAGACTFGATGSIGSNGVIGAHCGASGGSLTGTINDGSQNVNFTVTFTTAASIVVFSGTANKPSTGQSGPIVGVADAIPPNAVTAPTGGSCTNGTGRSFTIVGAATFALL